MTKAQPTDEGRHKCHGEGSGPCKAGGQADSEQSDWGSMRSMKSRGDNKIQGQHKAAQGKGQSHHGHRSQIRQGLEEPKAAEQELGGPSR